MKILDFESVSPFFSQERDGEKPFTTRKIDAKDKRFRSLAQWKPSCNWAIRITNPDTGEGFIRAIRVVACLFYVDPRQKEGRFHFTRLWDWLIIILGDKEDKD